MPMNFDSLASALSLSAPHEMWRADFDSSADFSLLPLSEHTHFRPQWDALCVQAGLSEEISGVLWQAMCDVRSSAPLSRLLAHARWCFFEHQPAQDPTSWPMLPAETGDAGRLFYAAVMMAELPRTIGRHRQRGIPPEITAYTFSDLELWLRHYHAQNGAWGFNEHGWLIKHLRGELFALGRLQFELCDNPLPFHAWQNIRDNRVILFAAADFAVRADGLFASADSGAAQDVFVTRYVQDHQQVTGHPVNERGEIQSSPLTLPFAQWRNVINPGDPSLGVHIPARGELAPRECEDSFARARDFFPRYFADRPIRGLWIESWLMDPQLADYLPAAGNIVQFQKFFFPTPFPHANDLQMRQRIFGVDQFKPVDELPGATRLQQIFVRHVRAGKSWRAAAGIRLP